MFVGTKICPITGGACVSGPVLLHAEKTGCRAKMSRQAPRHVARGREVCDEFGEDATERHTRAVKDKRSGNGKPYSH